MENTAIKTLIDFWKESNVNIEEIKLQESAIALQLNAENVIAQLRKSKLEAVQELERSKRNSQSNPSFQTIVENTIALDIVTKEFDIAIKVYENLFGEKPKFV